MSCSISYDDERHSVGRKSFPSVSQSVIWATKREGLEPFWSHCSGRTGETS